MRRLIKWLIVLLVLGGLAGGGGYYGWQYLKEQGKPTYRTAKVERGDIVLVVNSTGTVQPVQRVSVGSVVSGPVKELLATFNDEVKKDQVLAVIDKRLFEAAVARDNATLASANAELARVTAQLEQARRDEARAEALQKESADYISDTEMDRFKYSRQALEAQLSLAEAQIKQARSSLTNSETNLKYCDILSPVDGIVIDRKIDEGQTLAASFQAPELFVVAPEMDKRMWLYASVDESEIGHIRKAKEEGQKVQFTIDAYPEDLFEGKIHQLRLNPSTTQNVVTYTVIVEAPNPDRKLLPGMTANLSFEIERKEKILKVPNAALRFYPKPEQVRPEDKKLLETAADEKADESNQATTGQLSAEDRVKAGRKHSQRHVWVVEKDLLRAIAVTTGESDNRFTEVVAGDVKEGQEVVTGLKAKTQ